MDSIDVGVFASMMLKGCDLSCQLAHLKLLPFDDRLRFLEDIIVEKYNQLASDEILGRINTDGTRQDGEFIRKLSHGCDPLMAEEAFRNICFSLGQMKVDRKQYDEAVKCIYLSGRVNDTLGILFTALTSKLFTTMGAVSPEQAAQQQEVLKYYHIFERQIKSGAIQISHGPLWDDIQKSVMIVDALNLTRDNKLQIAISHMERTGLIPTRESIPAWINSPFSSLVPRLIDAYTFCLYETFRRGLWPPERRRDILEKTHRLFEVCNCLGDGPSAPSEASRQYLRELADACSS